VIQRVTKYFEKNVTMLWVIFPKLKMVKVFTSPKIDTTYFDNDLIPAFAVLPDLHISVNELFKNYN
jgi:hypothetical protein